MPSREDRLRNENIREQMLAALRQSGKPMATKELAELTGLTSNATWDKLARLMAHGIVIRLPRQHANRPAYWTVATPPYTPQRREKKPHKAMEALAVRPERRHEDRDVISAQWLEGLTATADRLGMPVGEVYRR